MKKYNCTDIIKPSLGEKCTSSFSGIDNRIIVVDLPEGENLPLETLFKLSEKHNIPISNIIIRSARKNDKNKSISK